jgi:hypothetical protein
MSHAMAWHYIYHNVKLQGTVEKVHFNHKVGSKDTKLKPFNIDLCDLCEKPLCPLWLMDLDFSYNPPWGKMKGGIM